jgi:hypothetical protein
MYKNIKFKYLYRDGGNYKKYHSIVFRNTQNHSVELLNHRLEEVFWSNIFFVASQIKLPELFFEDFPNDDDISFHEFDGIELTPEKPNDPLNRSIEDFVDEVRLESAKGWDVFDPKERFV